MTDRDTDPPTSRHAIDDMAEAVILTADSIDEIQSSLRGIHGGLGEMHSDLTASIAELTEAVRGMSANVRTALTAMPLITRRLSVVEAMLHVSEGSANGSSAAE